MITVDRAQNMTDNPIQPKAAVTTTDGSAAVSLEDQLREAQTAATIGTLAAGIARELNNSVAAILGNVELARQDVGSYAPALESLNEIRKAGARAHALAQQMLSFSRRQPTKLKRTRLGPFLEDSLHLLRATLPPRLSLELHCAGNLPPILADAAQIEQIVINLTAHAIQHMRSGRGHIDVRLDTVNLDSELAGAHAALRELHARQPGPTLRLAISDDGPAMDTMTLAGVFKHAVTAAPVEEKTGLDLSEVQAMVLAHNGVIVADSGADHGTTFTIYLPIAKAGSEHAPYDATGALAQGKSGDGVHILYIDDDDSLVFLVERFLERRGFRISGYVDQHEALNALSADPAAFDLAVVDYNMPGSSGLEIAREIRAIRSDLPVVVASGAIDDVLRAQAQGAGVRELIFKVSEVEDLCAAFARLAHTLRMPSESG